jgi:hypothetical protein
VRDGEHLVAGGAHLPHPLSGHGPTFLVLDGQQRLTSLYQAFYGVGEHQYFLNLRELLDGADFEDAIFHLRANHRRALRYEMLDTQVQELIWPLSALKGGGGEPPGTISEFRFDPRILRDTTSRQRALYCILNRTLIDRKTNNPDQRPTTLRLSAGHPNRSERRCCCFQRVAALPSAAQWRSLVLLARRFRRVSELASGGTLE